MAQQIKQANIFGRIGTGLGRGLAEQLPKEIERERLSSGLQSFEQEHQNLNPMQQLARLSAIPGVTPQTIQSFSELAKVNNQGNFYKNLAGYQPPDRRNPAGPQGSIASSPQQPNMPQINPQTGLPMQGGFNQQDPQQGQAAVSGQMQQRVATRDNLNDTSSENTYNPNALSRLPWTPERRNKNIADYILNGALPVEAKELTADDEARERGEAPVLQQRQRENMERTTTARNELDRQLETKLQKTGEEIYPDLTGEAKIKLQRLMNKALRNNANLSIEDAANEFSDRALSTAKAKGKFDTLAKTTGVEALSKGNDINSKLDDYSDAFRKSGNSEEYYNMLKRDPKDPKGAGFGLSSEGAATKAFPPSPPLSSYVKNYKNQNMKQTKYGEVVDPKRTEVNARKAANDIAKLLGENDSVLTIGRELRKKDPYFDQDAFYNEMRLIKDEAGLSERQVNELPERNTDWLPTWGDFLILPWGNLR